MDTLLTSGPIEAESLTAFKRAFHRRYIHAAHLEILDRKLEQVARFIETGGSEGIWLLIVKMPPRHGKTLTVSRLFPAWFLGRNPDKRVMLVSYGATLAQKNSRAARNIMQSELYIRLFGFELDPHSRAVDAWDLEKYTGGADAMGVLGGATGKGADLLIIDDPVKNRAEAESEVIRDRTWDGINDDLFTRLEPGGAGVMLATPWHEDDPMGRITTMIQDPDKCNGPVEILSLVALTETDEDVARDPLGRGINEALFPERFSVPVLKAIRERIGPYSWAGLYKMRPTPAEGGIFKRAWFYPGVDRVPSITKACRYWDLAMSAKTSADYTVGVKIGKGGDGHYYILDVVRRQIDWGDLVDWMAGIILQDGAECKQGIEEKGYMSRAIKQLNADPRLHGFQVWGYPVDTDKLTRALPVAAKLASGNVHMQTGYWNTNFVEEICSFPNAAHDDQVDALSGAWLMFEQGTVQGGRLGLFG